MGARLARALLVLALLGAGCSREAAPGGAGASAPPARPQPAPLFTLKDLKGNAVSLEGLRGQTVVIDFWATWCPPCEFQVPVLNAYYEAHHGGGVTVLGVAVDAEGRAAVAPYAARHKIRYPVLLGSEALARDYGAPGFPTLVVVAPDGSMVAQHVGVVEPEELDKLVAQARAGEGTEAKAGPAPATPGS
jgi:thiol-disulfide isomerase/thioredoxin